MLSEAMRDIPPPAARNGLAPNTWMPRRACMPLWPAPRGMREFSIGGSASGEGSPTRIACTSHVAPLCPTALFVPCGGSTFVAASDRSGAQQEAVASLASTCGTLSRHSRIACDRARCDAPVGLVPRRGQVGCSLHALGAAARPVPAQMAAMAPWIVCAVPHQSVGVLHPNSRGHTEGWKKI